MFDTVRSVLSALLTGLGTAVMLTAVFGVNRFRFVLNRMHCASMIDTLGMLLIVLGLALAAASLSFVLKLALILLLLWVSSPIASHLIARMELTTDESASSHLKED